MRPGVATLPKGVGRLGLGAFACALVAAACGGGVEPVGTPTSPAATAVVSTPTMSSATPAATSSTPGAVTRINPCPQQGVTELTGAGATFPYPLYSKLFDEYNKLCSVRVNYQSIGSGGGIAQLQKRTVDFAGSDAIMNDQQRSQAQGGAVLHIPVVAGALAVIYNVPGVQRGQLKIDPDVLGDIYLTKITKWNDPRIKAANPTVNLPNLDIAVVHRSDGSGTTYVFTDYLSKISSEWKSKVGSATSVNWPGVTIGGQGNEGVSNQVRQIPGAIGYVELAYAKQNNLAWAQLKNKSGAYTEPTIESAAAAADVPDLPESMEIVITDSANPQAYPIVGFTWILVYVNQTNAAKADAVARLAWWMTHDGQQYAPALDYVPLRGEAVAKAEVLVKKMMTESRPVLQ